MDDTKNNKAYCLVGELMCLVDKIQYFDAFMCLDPLICGTRYITHKDIPVIIVTIAPFIQHKTYTERWAKTNLNSLIAALNIGNKKNT